MTILYDREKFVTTKWFENIKEKYEDDVVLENYGIKKL